MSPKGKPRKSDMNLLPVTSNKPTPGLTYGLTRRMLRFIGAVALMSLAAFFLLPKRPQLFVLRMSETRKPPLYENFREAERHLPHYDTYEKNTTVKYFWAAQHAHSSGWGNVMQDYVMMALLAHAAGRSFVFDDYIWNPDGSTYSDYNGKLIPSRIPLTALLGGPIVGGPMNPGDDTPLSVNKHFFEKVCPHPTVIRVENVNTERMRFSETAPVTETFDAWVETLKTIEDPCLMLDPSSNQVFDNWVFGKKQRLLPLWTTISNSPILIRWDWSPLIHNAYSRNRHFFKWFPSSSRLTGLIDTLGFSGSEDPNTAIEGLLAIHVRRGDFEEHCRNLATWSADWHAWNAFPEFIDKFEKPTDMSPEETTRTYLDHCYPSIQQIVDKVKHVRQESQGTHDLRYLYIMTNGPAAWVEDLKAAFAQESTWESVKSSRDLELTWEEKFVAQGVDMFVAQRAEVIIGNGWSSLTSNVVMLRMAHGFPTDSNRFW
ncbi:hypothetical protein V8B97DRAFT_1876294 [Scleroderma yunnanense]